MSIAPGTCKKVTKDNVFYSGSGIGSRTKTPPTPIEYGRTVDSNGLTAIGAEDC